METSIEYPGYYKVQAYRNSEMAAVYLMLADECPTDEIDMYEWALSSVKRANIYWQAYNEWNKVEGLKHSLSFKRKVLAKLRKLDNS